MTAVKVEHGNVRPPTCFFEPPENEQSEELISATFVDEHILVVGTFRGKMHVLDLDASVHEPALSEDEPTTHPCVVLRTLQLNAALPVCSLASNGTHLASGSQGVIELASGPTDAPCATFGWARACRGPTCWRGTGRACS